jgi:hypothetical protein
MIPAVDWSARRRLLTEKRRGFAQRLMTCASKPWSRTVVSLNISTTEEAPRSPRKAESCTEINSGVRTFKNIGINLLQNGKHCSRL